MQKITKYARAAARAVAAPFVIGGVALLAVAQGLVIGPLTGNHTAIPNFAYNTMRRLFGIKLEFNKASAPLVKDKPVWYVANHLAVADFLVLGSKLEGIFAGKGDILKWPGVAPVARALKYIGLRREGKYNGESRAKIIKTINAGHNIIMFPEATTTDGKEVKLFRAGLITLAFGDKGVDKHGKEVTLEKDVVVQPIAIRVKEVEGKNAIGNDDLRNMYSMPKVESIFAIAWKQMLVRDMMLELTVLPPLDPKNYQGGSTPAENAMVLINQAALSVASIVNPGQTTFVKADIPLKAKKPKAP